MSSGPGWRDQSLRSFLLPDVGEGLTEAEIVAWHVVVGDTVAVNQVLVEIETAKSVVELPSPHAGRVVEILAAEGTTVPVGSAIIALAIDDGGGSTAPVEVSHAEADADQPRLLVGYGASGDAAPRRRRGRPTEAGAVAGTKPVIAPALQDSASSGSGGKPRAKPPVRKLAATLGVDLATVRATGPGGTVSREDVLATAEATADGRVAAAGERRIPVRGVRKHTAAAMVASAFTAPHVTEFVTVDVTRTLELRESVRRRPEFREVKLTPLAFVARAYLWALARTPAANGRWEEATQEIVIPAGVTLGIAAATPRGLVVPTIEDAHLLGLAGLAAAIEDLAAVARAGTTPPQALTGGTTTITNVGVFGVDAGTPILNPGETAILAVGAIRRRPWVVHDEAGERIEPRSVLQLALSFDHRVIDGQEGSQLLADTAALLAEPGLAML